MAYTQTIILMLQKVRALIEDFPQPNTEVFTYETSGIFTLAEPRVLEMVDVLINGNELISGQEAIFDSATNHVTVVNEDFVSGDIVSVQYTFSKYSDAELFEFVRAALVWLSVYDSNEASYKLTSAGLIIPSPTDKTLDLICLIASIAIKPDYISYKTGNMAVTYPTKATREEKILDVIQMFKTGIGVIGIIEYDRTW